MIFEPTLILELAEPAPQAANDASAPSPAGEPLPHTLSGLVQRLDNALAGDGQLL